MPQSPPRPLQLAARRAFARRCAAVLTLLASALVPGARAVRAETAPAAMFAASSLSIASADVNGGVSPAAATAFTVVVRTNSPVTSTFGMSVTLSRTGGTGTLSGTLTRTMTQGSTSLSFTNLTYNKAEGGVTITATRTSGDNASPGTSPAFTVVPTLAVTSVNGGASPVAGTSFSVVVQLQDGLGAVTNTGSTLNFSLSRTGGTGTLTGTTTGTIGVGSSSATVTGVNYTKAESGVSITATRTSGGLAVAAGTSATFTVQPGPATQLQFGVQPTSAQATVAISPAVTVRMLDSNGNVATNDIARNVTLAISTNPGGGTLSGTTTQAGSSGVATFAGLSIDKVGTNYTLIATSSPALATASSSAFNITVGAVARLAITSINSGSSPTAGLAFSVVVQSQDNGGNAANVTTSTGVSLNSNGSTALGGTTTGTIANGGSTVTIDNVTYTRAESLTITVNRTSGNNLTSGTSDFFAVLPAAASFLSYQTPPTTTQAASQINGAGGVQVVLRDAFSNTVTTDSRSVTIAIGNNGGSPTPGTLGGTTVVTPVAGVATFSVSIDKVGTNYTLLATASGLTSATSGNFNITQGPTCCIGVLSVNGGVSPTAASAFSVVVQSQDAGGNPGTVSASTAVALTRFAGNGTLTGTTTGTITNGASQGTISGILYSRAESNVQLAPTAAGLTSTPSAPFTVNPGTATKLDVISVNGGTNPVAGTAFAVLVQAEDPNGNASPLASATSVTLNLGAGTGALGGTLVGSIASGQSSVTFSNVTYTRAQAGVAIQAALTSGTSLETGTSAAFTVVPGAASKLVLSVPPTDTVSTAVINGTGGVKVEVRDASDNLITTDTRNITLAIGTKPGNGVLSGTKTVAAVGGVATFTTLSINEAGAGYTLVASSNPALITATSGLFSIFVGPPTQLAVTSINGGTSPTAGTPFDVVVEAHDAGGNAVLVAADTAFTLTRGAGTGTLGGPAAGTIAAGTSTVGVTGLTYTKAETGVRITATRTSGDALAAGTSAAVTVSAGLATQLVVSSVNGGTSVTAGSPFAVVVQSQDALGNPSSPTQPTDVSLSVAAGAGSLGGTITGTISSASPLSVSGVTYTKAESGVSVTATATSGDALTAGTSAAFTVNAGAATKLAVTSVNGGSTVTAAVAFPVVVQSLDTNGNPSNPSQATGVSLTVATGSGTLGGTLTGTIPTSSSSVVLGGATYTRAESGVSLTATVTGGSSLTAGTSATFTVEIGAPAKLVVASVNGGTSPTAATPFDVVVDVQDAGGNAAPVVADTAIALARGAGTDALGGTTTGTIAAGTSAVTISGATYVKAESGITIVATATGGDTLTAGTSASVTVVPGPASRLVVVSVNNGNTVTAGSPFAVVVQSQDANGNPSSPTQATAVSLDVATGAGTLGGTLAGTISSSSPLTLNAVTYTKAESGVSVTATATSGDTLTAGTSAPFSATAGAATKLAVTSINGGNNVVAAAAFPVVVQSQDANGNPSNPGQPVGVALTVATGSGTLGGTLTGTIPASSSSAVLDGATYTKAESGVSLTATAASGSGLAAGTSAAFTVNVGMAARLVVTSVNGGANPTSAAPFDVIVGVQDGGGNPTTVAADTAVALARGAGTGTLGGTRTGTMSAGTGSVTISGAMYVKAESGVTIVASRTGGDVLTAGTSAPFAVTPGGAVLLAFAAPPTRTAEGRLINNSAGVSGGVRVEVRDVNNNLVVTDTRSVTIAIGANPAAGALGGTATVSAVGGVATFTTLSISKAGQGYTLVASSTPALTPSTSPAFNVNPLAPADTDLIRNGDFSGGATAAGPAYWAVTQNTDVAWTVSTGNVFQFNLVNPGGQALLWQSTGRALLANSPLQAQFDLGNSSTVPKRLRIRLGDDDAADLVECSFLVPAGSPTRTYQMLAHPTQVWANLSIAISADTAGADGGINLVDNVSLRSTGQVTSVTSCIDPNRPRTFPSGADDAANLLTNGDFASGALAPWTASGTIATQITAGVLEFIRPTAAAPAGVVAQSSGQAIATAGQILTATFQLGNSSAVRKRVTVWMHEADFSDGSVCTFWVPPGFPLLNYAIRGFTSRPWTNASVSIVPESVGTESWIRVDNVALRRTGSWPTAGTECIEPVPGVVGGIAVLGDVAGAYVGRTDVRSAISLDGGSNDWLGTGAFARTPDASSTGTGPGWRAEAWTSGRAVLAWAQPIDLTRATSAGLSFQSWLSARATSASTGEVQVSADGVTWQTVASVPRTDAWVRVDVDLADFLGQIVFVRFVYDAVAPDAGVEPDVWRIDEVVVAIGWAGMK